MLPKPCVEKNAGIEEFVAAIQRRYDEKGLSTPWSIAELELDDEDYRRLGFWAGCIDRETVDEWAKNDWAKARPPVREGRSRRACLGLLLLTLAAEVARREATEATLWRYIRDRADQTHRFRADAVLFVQGQPSPLFKLALRAAVKEFELRNVAEDDDTKRYYLTVFLQFGFGIRDAEQRLAGWLAGQTPQVAIEQLATRGGRLGSDSFAALWRDLRHGRGGLLPAEALRKRLQGSPWVLPGWAETLAGLVRRSLPSASTPGKTTPRSLETILGLPRLVWPSGESPRFACKINDLATARLSGREYTLRVAGRVVARIERGDETFESDGRDVEVPGFPAVAAVELRDEETGASEDLPIECFDPQEPAQLFDLRSGRPVTPGTPPEASGRYALIFADDLTLSPEPADWCAVRCGTLRLRVAALAGADAATARLSLGDATVWEARSPSVGPSGPSWARASLELAGSAAGLSSLPLGRSYQVAIRHPTEVRVTFARRGMEPLEPTPREPGVTHVGPITTTVPALARDSRWLIGLEREGASARIAPEFRPPRHGGAIFRGDGWEVLDPRNALDADDARHSPVLIAPPSTWGGQVVGKGRQTWAVMEGEDWVDVPGARPRIVPRLSGLGGPLTVRLGPFNAVPATPPDGGPSRLDALVLADRVVDRGIVRGVVLAEATEDAHAWRIELSHEVEIDERHEVHWWDRSGEVHRRTPSAWPIGEPTRHNWWSIEPPPVASEPRALLVTYSGRRLGAWWAADWADGLAEVATARGPKSIADLVRLAKLPVLEARSLPEVRRLAERWPVELLGSWLTDEALDGWRFAIRFAFREWRPGPGQVETLALALGKSAPIPEVGAALRLMEIYPVLMGRFLKARAVDASPEEMRMVYREIRARVEADLRFEVCDFVGSDETVHDGIKRMTCLDRVFLESLNKAGIAAVLDLPTEDEFDQRRNLDLAATQFTACRMLLALDILQSLEAGEISHWKGGRCGTA